MNSQFILKVLIKWLKFFIRINWIYLFKNIFLRLLLINYKKNILLLANKIMIIEIRISKLLAGVISP